MTYFFVLCTFCEWSIVLSVLKGHHECLKCGKTSWRPRRSAPDPDGGAYTALPRRPSWWGWGWLPLSIHRRILVNGFGEVRSEARRAKVGGRKSRERGWGSCQKTHQSGHQEPIRASNIGLSGLAPCFPKSVYRNPPM